jgi:hypothetical protein
VGITVAAMTTCGEPARARPVQVATDLGTLTPAAGATDDAGTFESSLTSAHGGHATVTATVDGVKLAPVRANFSEPAHSGGGCSSAGEGNFAALLLMLLAMWGARAGRRAVAVAVARRREVR